MSDYFRPNVEDTDRLVRNAIKLVRDKTDMKRNMIARRMLRDAANRTNIIFSDEIKNAQIPVQTDSEK